MEKGPFLADLVQGDDADRPGVGGEAHFEALGGFDGGFHCPEQGEGQFDRLERLPLGQVLLQDGQGLGHEGVEHPALDFLQVAALLDVGKGLADPIFGEAVLLGELRQAHPMQLVDLHEAIAGLIRPFGELVPISGHRSGQSVAHGRVLASTPHKRGYLDTPDRLDPPSDTPLTHFNCHFLALPHLNHITSL